MTNMILKNQLIPLPAFDVYTRNKVQISQLDQEPFSLSPVFTYQDGSNIVFEKSASSVFWTKPEIYIHAYVTAKKAVTAADGKEKWEAIAPTDVALGLSSFPLSSLFSSIDMYVNDVLVTDKDQLYPFISFLKLTHMINADERGKLEASCLGYKFPAGKLADPDCTEHLDIRKVIAGKKELLLIDKIRLPLLEQEKLLLPGVSLKFVFTQTSSDFRCISIAGKTATGQVTPASKMVLNIEKIFLHGTHIVSNDGLYVATLKELQNQPANYSIKRYQASSFQFPTGAQEVHHPISLASSILPSVIFVMGVDAKDFYGQLAGSPYKSSMDDIKKICIKFENLEFPRGGYDLSDRNGQLQAFNDFKENIKMLKNSNTYNETKFEEFSSTYCVACICLDRYLGSSAEHATSLSRSGYGELVIQLKAPSSESKTYLIVCIYNNSVSFNEGMSVKLDY